MSLVPTPTESSASETDTLFITATAVPFVPLPDVAPFIAHTYTLGPAVLYLILFTAVAALLSWRIHVTGKEENARRTMMSGAVFAWVRMFTFIFRICLIYAYSLGLYVTYVFNVLRALTQQCKGHRACQLTPSFNIVPAFLYTGLTFHLLLLSLLPKALPAFTVPTSKVIKASVVGYAPFLVFGVLGLVLSFTARDQYMADIARNMRVATGAALLFLALVLVSTALAALWYLRKHADSCGLDEGALERRQQALLLVTCCGSLFMLKFAYGVAAMLYSPFAPVNSEAAWYCLSILPELLSLIPFLYPGTVRILAVPRATTSVSTAELVPADAAEPGRWADRQAIRKVGPESVAGKGPEEGGRGSFDFLSDSTDVLRTERV
ncbi:hypothetical protein DFJ74DRAFT_265402 [Hyaloraphidium curvatum]|nr:hypothetical protein DFJ74DRAFT_265402 [Hyaloraphidium curvatum]